MGAIKASPLLDLPIVVLMVCSSMLISCETLLHFAHCMMPAACAISPVTCTGLQLPALEEDMINQLLPKDPADTRGVVLEVHSGAGGDEAALFAAELLRMYEHFCSSQGWRFEVCHGAR